MGFYFGPQFDERLFNDARRFLGAWQIDLVHDHELRVKPLRPDLNYDELFDLVRRLAVSGVLSDVALVFDCGELRSINTPWMAVFALWLHLARMAPRGCRLLSLSGEPASMAALAFRGVPESLIRVEPRRTRDAA